MNKQRSSATAAIGEKNGGKGRQKEESDMRIDRARNPLLTFSGLFLAQTHWGPATRLALNADLHRCVVCLYRCSYHSSLVSFLHQTS